MGNSFRPGSHRVSDLWKTLAEALLSFVYQRAIHRIRSRRKQGCVQHWMSLLSTCSEAKDEPGKRLLWLLICPEGSGYQAHDFQGASRPGKCHWEERLGSPYSDWTGVSDCSRAGFSMHLGSEGLPLHAYSVSATSLT